MRRGRAYRVLSAEQVVFAASALGTQRLLHRMRDEGVLPNVSHRLGHLTRTNSESILGAVSRDRGADFTPRRRDHLVVPPRPADPHRAGALRQGQQRHEPPADGADRRRARDGRAGGSGCARCGGSGGCCRACTTCGTGPSGRSSRSVMQSLDNSITTYTRRSRLTGRRRLTSRQGHGQPNPTWIPVANDAVRRMARRGRRHPRRHHRRAVQAAADRALHRRLRDRRQPADRASSTRTSGSTAIPGCTSSTARPSRPTSASTRRSRSPPRPSGRWRSGRTRATSILARRSGSPYQRIAPVSPAAPAVPATAPGALGLPIVGIKPYSPPHCS